MNKPNPIIQRKDKLANGFGRKEKGGTVFRRNICTLSKVRGKQKRVSAWGGGFGVSCVELDQ
jgi:hypothetical protein